MRISIVASIDGVTKLVSNGGMTEITSKVLHEKTGQMLDRARQGERFRVVCDGRTDAFLIPAAESVDPEWDEIMKEVWERQQKGGKKRANPVLKERARRNYGSRVR